MAVMKFCGVTGAGSFVLILAIVLLSWTAPVLAATLVWSDNFDSYPSGIGNAPPSPWTSVNGYVVTNYSETSPNSLGVGNGGNNGYSHRLLLISGNMGYVDMWALYDDSNGLNAQIGIFNPSNDFLMGVEADNTGWESVMSPRVWHHFVMSFNTVNSPDGYTNLYVDGVLNTRWSHSGAVTNGPGNYLQLSSQTISGNQIEIYGDTISVYSGCYAPDCVAPSNNARAWLIQ